MTPNGASGRLRTIALRAALLGMLALSVLSAGCSATPSQKPLAESLPAEAALRSLRLVGIDEAAVGEQGGTVTLRLVVPVISSAGDLEIGYQSGIGVLVESYPKARRYVVRLASAQGESLVEFAVSAAEARELVGNAKGIRAEVRYLVAGEGPMPDDTLAIGPQMGADMVTVGYLDAKNRAALPVLAGNAPASWARAGSREASATRAAVPGRPAPAADQDAAAVFAGVLRELLARPAADAIDGVDALRTLADSLEPSGPERVLALRRWIAVAEMTTAEEPFGEVSGAANLTARAVSSAKLPSLNDKQQGGLKAAAILADAQSPGAPAEMRVVERFTRGSSSPDIDLFQASTETSSAAGASTATGSAIGRQFATVRAFADRLALESRSDGSAPSVSWETSAGATSASSPLWLAFQRRDGRIFWLLGEGAPAALTDASLDGWAWSARRVAVVDSADVGRVLATIEVR